MNWRRRLGRGGVNIKPNRRPPGELARRQRTVDRSADADSLVVAVPLCPSCWFRSNVGVHLAVRDGRAKADGHSFGEAELDPPLSHSQLSAMDCGSRGSIVWVPLDRRQLQGRCGDDQHSNWDGRITTHCLECGREGLQASWGELAQQVVLAAIHRRTYQ